MACEANHIDLSPSLFDYIAGADTDMVTDADWEFGSFNTPKPTPSTTYHSTTKDKPMTTPEPTTTSTTSTVKTVKSSSSSSSSSSTTKVTTTTTTTTTSSSSSSLTSSTITSSSASVYVTPVAYDDGQVHNIQDFETLLVIMGRLVLGA